MPHRLPHVAERRHADEMQLLGVHHAVSAVNPLTVRRERGDGKDAPEYECEDARLPVERRDAMRRDAMPLALDPREEPRDPVRPHDDPPDRRRFPAAIADERCVVVEEGKQRVAVAVAERREEAREQPLLRVGRDGVAGGGGAGGFVCVSGDMSPL